MNDERRGVRDVGEGERKEEIRVRSDRGEVRDELSRVRDVV